MIATGRYEASAGDYLELSLANGADAATPIRSPRRSVPTLTSISIANFKGIREPIKLVFAPLTLLFGANSAGKSTIIHALQFAREVLERHNLDADFTLGGGEWLDLGGYRSFVHQHEINREVTIGLSAQTPPGGLPPARGGYETIGRLLGVSIESFVRQVEQVDVEFVIRWSFVEKCPYVANLRVSLNGAVLAEIEGNSNLRGAVISRLNLEHPCLMRYGNARYGREQPSLFDRSTLLAMALNQCSHMIAPGDGERFELQNQQDALFNLDGRLWLAEMPFSPPDDENGQQQLADELNSIKDVETALTQLIAGPVSLVRDALRESCHLGPLREMPPRSQIPPKSPQPHRWYSGLAAWDTLQVADDSFVSDVAGWLLEDGKLGRTFQHYFDPARGSVSQLMQQQIGPNSLFGRALDPKNKDGILTQIEGRVQRLVEAKLEEVLGQFSLDNEESAMCRLQKVLTDSFGQIHLTLGVKSATAAEAERGHVKGMEFEASLYDAFAENGRRLGDETEFVRGTPGTLRKKTGDFVATLGETTGAPGTRMTIEVKDQALKLKAAIDELQEAKRNREATVGIFVFAKGCEPTEVGDFRRIGEDFFCTVDKAQLDAGEPLLFFDAAYQIARALAVAAARQEEAGTLDAQKLKDHVDALISFSERLSDITTKARTVKSSGESIEKAAETLKKELDTRLLAMQGMLVVQLEKVAA